MGYLMTQWDCPECEAGQERDGDCAGEILECADCGHVVKIMEVK
jgi:hypothetical protein